MATELIVALSSLSSKTYKVSQVSTYERFPSEENTSLYCKPKIRAVLFMAFMSFGHFHDRHFSILDAFFSSPWVLTIERFHCVYK